MSDNTKIDWADASINPLGWGCYGPGGSAEQPRRCPWCYAYRMAKRKLRKCPQCNDFVPHWHQEEIAKLRAWLKPRRIFLGSMCDPFGYGVSPARTRLMVEAARRAFWHTYIMLTKCPERVLEYERWAQDGWGIWSLWPANLWLVTSVTNQADAEQRVPLLLSTIAPTKGVSIEPLLGTVDLSRWLSQLDWVLVGALTGPGSIKRAPKREWIESIVEQCKMAGVPVFLKRNLRPYWGSELIQEYPI